MTAKAGPRLPIALVAALILGACTLPASVPIPPSPSVVGAPAGGALPPNTFQILHTNDVHGHLEPVRVTIGGQPFEHGGMALLGGMIERQRARAPGRTLVLDAGDAWTGTLISAIDHGASVVKAMSLIGYDAMAIGNHDFDWGQDRLARRAAEAGFPFLAANLLDANGMVPAFAKPYIVKDLGIAKVGIIGLTNPETGIIKASSITGLRFLPGIEAVRRYLPEVRRQADVIVVLSHLGLEGGTAHYLGGDTALAKAVPGIDVIISGHDHVALSTPQIVGTTKLFETGAYAENLGRVEVSVDPVTRKVTAVSTSGVLLPVATGKASPLPAVAKLVAERQAEADKYGKRVVGTATGFFAAERDMNSPLGNLVADALLAYGRQQGWKSDVSFYNGAGVRAPIQPGPVTYAALAEVLPFQNTVVSVDLTGGQLKQVLEGMAGSAGRLFMGGGTMSYRFSNAAGARVLGATVGGRPLDPDRVYHVATIDYLLGGGDGHAEFTRGTNVIYGDVDLDVVSAYVQAHSPISPTSPGRVTQE